ncbi:MAG TPA: antibiotic biosynthesis monooxygenase [Candidatus Margulisiibacteriota bacterium]|nr:antibiotic biosynthesis monooxygenase [Candidatus Margulisiibacteriota bacterium]
MVLVLFRSKLTAHASDDYKAMADEMLARARTMAGFLDFKSFGADDGERLSVIRWESQDSMRAWTDDVRHVIAQRLGREKWYEYFRVEVAEVVRSYGFDRTS